MSDLEAYLWISFGIAAAVAFPVIRNLVTKYWPKTQAMGVPDWVKKYGVLFIFSLLTGVIVYAVLKSQGQELTTWWAAFLAGFAWESAVEKIGTKSLPVA